MTAQQALDEFVELSVDILDRPDVDAQTRTAELNDYITKLLKKSNFEEDSRLFDLIDCSRGCKLIVPISYKRHVGTTCTLRNFEVRREQALNLTVTEALLATLATPPLFTSISISKDFATFEYIGADFSLGNPVRELIAEAYGSFGGQESVACLLSLGSGHHGIVVAPEGPDLAIWIQFLNNLVTSSEQTAQEIASQMGHLGLYHRFSVARGLERQDPSNISLPTDYVAHTATYLADIDISQKLDLCVESLRTREGAASLEQLKHSGGQTVSPPAIPPLSRTFVMRQGPWDFLEKAILSIGDLIEGPRMLVVTGIGGCGKTQLILKFMRVHENKFVSTFFIDGTSESRIRADILRCVRSLSPAHSQKGFEDCLLFLAQPVTDSSTRLIVYDNVDNPDIDLSSLIPDGDCCAIIVTSRNRSLGEMCPNAHLELDVMSIEEAIEVLLPISAHSRPITEQAREEARLIAAALGCLPIALTQARSYMFQTKCSGRAYLERLQSSRDKLLAFPVKHQRDMRYLSTYAAFEASFSKLPTNTQNFLRLFSCIYWKDFPLELVTLAAKYKFSDYEGPYVEHGKEAYVGKALLKEIFLHDGEWDLTILDEMLISLQNYSLVTLVMGVDTMLLHMHPLPHAWVRSCIPEQEVCSFQSAAVLLLALGARNDPTPSAQYLANHVTHLSTLWDKLHINNAEAFALILSKAGRLESALRLREKVAADIRQELEPRSPVLSCSLSALALTYYDLGRFQDALKLQEEVVEIRKEVLGERNRDTITAYSRLAHTYAALARYEEAFALYKQVLELRKETLGVQHPDTIRASSNLASFYSSQRRLQEALILQEQSVTLLKGLLGVRHPDTIDATNNLANTYQDLGRLDEALILKEDVLKLSKEILGVTHPDTIRASGNLAAAYFSLRRLNEAVVLEEEVLKWRKENLGERHPNTMLASSNLATTYSGLGRLDEALARQEEVLKMCQETLGGRHLQTIVAHKNLACTYSALGRFGKACSIWEEVSTLRKEILGARHPDTISAFRDLGVAYFDVGRTDEARIIEEEVLQQRKEILGQTAPATMEAMIDLTITYHELGRVDDARVLEEELVRLRTDAFGQRHPDTIDAALDLAETYEELGQGLAALNLLRPLTAIISETLGDANPQYSRCQEAKSRIEGNDPSHE